MRVEASRNCSVRSGSIEPVEGAGDYFKLRRHTCIT